MSGDSPVRNRSTLDTLGAGTIMNYGRICGTRDGESRMNKGTPVNLNKYRPY